MNCLLVPVLVKRSFSARETLSLLQKRGWRGARGKGSYALTYTLLAPVVLEIRSACAVAQKGTDGLSPVQSQSPSPAPQPRAMVRELLCPGLLLTGSELCLSLLMDTQDQGLLLPRFLRPCMFNYGLLSNINPSIPKEDYSSLKEHRDKPGGRELGLSLASPSEHPKPEQHVCILIFHTLSEIKVYINFDHIQPAS